MIAYEDDFAVLEWLAKAFGFRERTRMAGSGGRLAQAEMEAGEGRVRDSRPQL